MSDLNIPDVTSVSDMAVWANGVTQGLFGWAILLLVFVVAFRYHETEGTYPAARFALTLTTVVATLLLPVGIVQFGTVLTLATLTGLSLLLPLRL